MANPEWKLRIGSCNGPQKIHRFDPHLRPCKSRRSWRTINCYKIADTWWFSEFLIFFFYFKSGWIEIEWTQNPWSWTVIDLWWSQGYCYIIQCILNNICTVLRNLNFYFWHFFKILRTHFSSSRWWGYVRMALEFMCPQTVLIGKGQRTYLTSPTVKTHMRVQVS